MATGEFLDGYMPSHKWNSCENRTSSLLLRSYTTKLIKTA